MSETILLAIIGAAAAILGAVTSHIVTLRRATSDVHQTDVNTQQDVIEMLREEVARLQKRVTSIEAREGELLTRLDSLSDELRSARIDNMTLKQENEQLRHRITELESERRQQDAKIAELEAVRVEQNSKIAELVQRVNRMTAEIGMLQGRDRAGCEA